MKRNNLFAFCIGMVLSNAFVACDPAVQTVAVYPVQVDITLPIAVDSMHTMSVQSVTIECADLNMGKSQVFGLDGIQQTDSVHIRASFSLAAGYYDMSTTITALLDSTSVSLRAYAKSVIREAKEDTCFVTMTASVVQERNTDFIFAEIFTAGTQTPEGKTYTGDSYFVLYNNTDNTLYADGLVLLESKLKNTQKVGELTPYFITDYFGVDAMYRIPGSGTDYPVPAGWALLIVDNAQNHKKANVNSFDLSAADFEWYDQSTVATVTDIDNADVPNLDKLYCYSRTLWIPNRQANTSFAIGRIPAGITDSAYLKDYYCTYDYMLITSAGTYYMSQDCYLFPNEWVVDCVNLCPHSTYQWLVTSAGLDAGWTYIGETGADDSRYSRSVRRRETTVDGQRRLQDTNNSTLDFLPMQTADPFYFK